MSLKLRIIAWFSLMILLLSALIVTVVFAVSDEALADDPAEDLIRTVSLNASRLTRDKKKQNDDKFISYRDGIYCQLLTDDGGHIEGVMPEGISLSTPLQNGKISTVVTSFDEFFVYDMQLVGNYWIRGAVSTSQPSQTTAAILLTAAIVTPCIIIVSILGGLLITKHSLKPVDKMIGSMEEINNGDDLSKRLSMTKGAVEIRRLANEFDRMLSRLDKSFEAEKALVQDASHELKTPLTVILGECHRAKSLPQSEEMKKSIEVIERQGSRMSELVSTLLSITRLEQKTESYPISLLNLSDFLEVYCEAFAQENDISLEGDGGKRSLIVNIEKDIVVPFNPSLMSRIICNLLDNAKKFTNENGEIRVTLSSDGNEAVMEISDNGIGISEENLPLIWRRFWQADPSREANQGNGLGLSLVKEMVLFQNGTITAQSQLGKGTAFTVRLAKKYPFEHGLKR